jgi:GntR family transcriptional regulator
MAPLANANHLTDDVGIAGACCDRFWRPELIEKKVSTRPLYLQVRDHLAREIAARIRRPGSALPNEVDLARQLGVSAGTLRKALEALEQERLITRQQGRGTYVRDDSAADASIWFENLRTSDSEPIPADVAFLGVTGGPATDAELQHLGLTARELVVRTRQVRSWQGAPFTYEEASLPASRFSGLEPSALTGPYQLSALAQNYGALLGGGSETVEIVEADTTVANQLGVATGTPVLKLDRVIRSRDAIPLEWRVAYCYLRSAKYVADLH